MLPSLFDLFKMRHDGRQEILLMELQLKYRQQTADLTLDLKGLELDQAALIADVQEHRDALRHDAELLGKASKFVASYAAMVRPNITYLLVIEIMMLTIFAGLGYVSLEWYQVIWNEGTQGIFSTIIMFYFGNRSFNRNRRWT